MGHIVEDAFISVLVCMAVLYDSEMADDTHRHNSRNRIAYDKDSASIAVFNSMVSSGTPIMMLPNYNPIPCELDPYNAVRQANQVLPSRNAFTGQPGAAFLNFFLSSRRLLASTFRSTGNISALSCLTFVEPSA